MRAWSDLVRRRVPQALITYSLGTWLLLQVADVVGPSLGLPPNTVTWLLVLAAVGVVPFLVGAWLYDVRRGRLVRTAPPPVERSPDAALSRVAVVPFRLLRPADELHYLGFALADAIAVDLASIRSLVVDTSALVPANAGPLPDSVLDSLNAEVVLTGTIMPEDGRIEVRPQLTSLATRRLLWSDRLRLPSADLYLLQNRVAEAVVKALASRTGVAVLPRNARDVPSTPRAYEFYLRANHLSVQSGRWPEARALYVQSLEEDREFAPGWARLGRCERLIGKWTAGEEERSARMAAAGSALEQALSLNPELPLAHSQYAQLELDRGRSEEAMIRLLARSQASGEHPDLLAGLVQACRFCGLLPESVAAAERARALDPKMRTSVAHTHLMAGEYERALAEYSSSDIGYMEGLALALDNRTEEALTVLRARERERAGLSVGLYITSLRALLEGNREEAIEAAQSVVRTGFGMDGEALFYMVRQLALLGERAGALALFPRVTGLGFVCYPMFQRDPWLDSLREEPAFREVMQYAELRHRQARASWLEYDGPAVVGLPQAH